MPANARRKSGGKEVLATDVLEIEAPKRLLVGFSIRASLNEIIQKKLGNSLRDALAARSSEIANTADDGVYLVQIYEPGPWSPDTPFTQVMGREVAEVADLPSGMVTHTIPAGKYLRFIHTGPMNTIGASYDAMHHWLMEQKLAGPCPYDFEYWPDVTRLEEEDTVIALHLPVDRTFR